MDQNEHRPEKLTLDRDSQINVVVNTPDYDEDSIDLGRVFHNMKLKSRIYAWVLILCMLVGLCAPLLMYQLSKPMLTVSSVVTLNYDIISRDANNRVTKQKVTDLTAPDGTALDLNQITSAYVLQQALSGLHLSQVPSLSTLRANIKVERVLTEDSRRAQELASQMTADKSNAAYAQMQAVQMTYANKFVVSLTNGFGEEDSRSKQVLSDDELRLLLNHILSEYNKYLVMTYADMKLPDDEVSVIDTANLDYLESLDLLREASDNLVEYIEAQPADVRAYRSHTTGRTLEDWQAMIQTMRDVSADYLYSYIYNNSLYRDGASMLTRYQYQLRNLQTELDSVNENIATNAAILAEYKNDEIFVSVQESDASKSTRATTDYYNSLVLQQSKNYDRVADLESQILDLQDKIEAISAAAAADGAAAADAGVQEELDHVMTIFRDLYQQVRAHMEELMSSWRYTDYVEYTDAQGRLPGFIAANMKKMIIGAVVGAVLACGLWFLAALAPEFRRNREDEMKKEAAC